MEIAKKAKNYKWFVGIDVSKNELDFAVLRNGELLQHMEILNKRLDIRTYCQFLKKDIQGFRIANTLFCMENTGTYGLHLIKVLHALKANFTVENPLKIKRSSGIVRGKGDREDAILIASYASRHYQEMRLWRPARPILAELKQLMALRNRLVTTAGSLNNPVKENLLFTSSALQRKVSGLCKTTVDAIGNDRDVLDAAIDELIKGDARIKRLFEIVTSVKCIGKITAIYIILSTNEFLDINCPKKFACYCGVAPFKNESGKKIKRPRISGIANRNMKTLLHMCATGASLRNQELRQYYERKTKVEGKPKMAVINALRNKLILRIFTWGHQDRLYTDAYIRPAANARRNYPIGNG